MSQECRTSKEEEEELLVFESVCCQPAGLEEVVEIVDMMEAQTSGASYAGRVWRDGATRGG